MRYILVCAVFVFAGCYGSYKPLSEEERAAKRAELVKRFQEAYPDNWKQKLLEYDLQREAEARRMAADVLSRPPVHNPTHFEVPETPEPPQTNYPTMPPSYHVKPDGFGGYYIKGQ